MPAASDYVADLAAHGRYHFTTQEAVDAIGESVLRVRSALRRLKADGVLVDPYRGFHVILPPEHQHRGCPPPQDLVPPLMQHLDEQYYVALLSAAGLYGATSVDHHLFQVMTRLGRKPIDCGPSRLQFVGRKDLDGTPVEEEDTPRGTLRVASPEATALELVGYSDQCGGLRPVTSVLSEIADVLTPERLVSVAPQSPIVWSQRLGYLLDLTDHRLLANALVPVVKDLAQEFAPLVRARPSAGAKRVSRWKLAVNANV